MNRVGFILAVESYLVRKGLVAILNRIPGIVVIREFDSAPPLIDFLRERNNDYLVISQSIFDQAIEMYLSESPLLEKTILVTDNPVDYSHFDLQASINIRESKEQITEKIKTMVDTSPDQLSGSRVRDLTEREKTIVRLVSLGFTNKQIAGQLFLSAHTVITHRKNISSKLGIKSVSGLTVYAIVNNIITIEEVTSKPDQ
jgi:DNA-binding CsgD family transcriptional regulator